MIVPLEKNSMQISKLPPLRIFMKSMEVMLKKKNQVEGFTADLNTQDNLKMNEKCNAYPFQFYIYP